MLVLTGKDELTHLYESRHIDGMKKRYGFSRLMDYLHREYDRRVFTIWGLRYTGKTTLMVQAAKELGEPEQTCWITCEKGDTVDDLKQVLNTHDTCRYFFLSEATLVEDFMRRCSILADKYSEISNKRIVLTGQNPLLIGFALGHALFDRSHVLSTTYMPFSEYCHLFGHKKTIDEYIESGGVLMDGKALATKAQEYLDREIAENVQSGIKEDIADRRFPPTNPWYSGNNIRESIKLKVKCDTYLFLADIVNQLLDQHAILLPGSKEPVREIRAALAVDVPDYKNIADGISIKVEEYLGKIDVYPRTGYHLETDPYFTQPGLQYHLVKRGLPRLAASPLLRAFSRPMRKELARQLDAALKERIMQNILRLELRRNPKVEELFDVRQYSGPSSHTDKPIFDFVLLDKESYDVMLLSVMYASVDGIPPLARNLMDPNACESLEKVWGVHIIGKAILYPGHTYLGENGVFFCNIETFLEDPISFLTDLRNMK